MKKNSNKDSNSLENIVDNGTTYANVGHIFHGDKDVCLGFFGEQDEECIKHNGFLKPLTSLPR